MRRLLFPVLAIFTFVQLILSMPGSSRALEKEWAVRTQRGTLRVVDLRLVSGSVMMNYAEGLVTLDKDNNWVPCLAEDWRWIDDRTIEFVLLRGVTFHNGERFDAEAVRVNWDHYRAMECPRPLPLLVIPDETTLTIVDAHTVRFTFPEPNGLALVQFRYFFQFAPAFFVQHDFPESNWGYLPQEGPWGTGPFELVEGSVPFGKPSDKIVLEAYSGYWDRKYPRVKHVIFDNTLIGDREEAMRLCRETEGEVDIVSFIRPLDTLKVAESQYAKVVKSKDATCLRGTFNQRKRDSKWKDLRLRQALNYAVNREELWKYAARGNAYNLGGLIPPGACGYTPDFDAYNYDSERARTLLKEAGYANGFEVKILTWEGFKLEAQIMSKMLERIDLAVRLNVLPWPEFLSRIHMPSLDKPPEEQEWDIYLSPVIDYWGHIGASFLAWDTEGSDFRWAGYDPVYEQMWKDMAATVDKAKQGEKIRLMEKYVYERANSLYVYSPLSLYAVNKEVNLVPQKSGYLRLKETSVTDNHWSIREQN